MSDWNRSGRDDDQRGFGEGGREREAGGRDRWSERNGYGTERRSFEEGRARNYGVGYDGGSGGGSGGGYGNQGWRGAEGGQAGSLRAMYGATRDAGSSRIALSSAAIAAWSSQVKKLSRLRSRPWHWTHSGRCRNRSGRSPGCRRRRGRRPSR